MSFPDIRWDGTRGLIRLRTKSSSSSTHTKSENHQKRLMELSLPVAARRWSLSRESWNQPPLVRIVPSPLIRNDWKVSHLCRDLHMQRLGYGNRGRAKKRGGPRVHGSTTTSEGRHWTTTRRCRARYTPPRETGSKLSCVGCGCVSRCMVWQSREERDSPERAKVENSVSAGFGWSALRSFLPAWLIFFDSGTRLP